MVILNNIVKAKSAHVRGWCHLFSQHDESAMYHQESGATVTYNYSSALQAKLNDWLVWPAYWNQSWWGPKVISYDSSSIKIHASRAWEFGQTLHYVLFQSIYCHYYRQNFTDRTDIFV